LAEGEVGFNDFDSGVLGRRQGSDGKSVDSSLHQPPKQPKLKCPECSSQRLCRDGIYYPPTGESIQRWLCKDCGYRFSEHKPQVVSHENVKQSINTEDCLVSGYRLCAKLKVKKLDAAETKTVAGDIAPSLEQQTRKGLIINFMLYMKKQGFRPSTISTRAELMTTLLNQGVDLNNTEDVKFAIADKKCSEGYKKNLVLAYDTLLRMQGKKWDKPKYKPVLYTPSIGRLIMQTVHAATHRHLVSATLNVAHNIGVFVKVQLIRYRDALHRLTQNKRVVHAAPQLKTPLRHHHLHLQDALVSDVRQQINV